MSRERFNPQVGEKVRVRSWDDMEAEFGLDPCGDIKCEFVFIKSMRSLEGKEFVISKIDGAEVRGLDTTYSISIDMLEYPQDDGFDETEELNEFINSFNVR